jgi:hypothetical protein
MLPCTLRRCNIQCNIYGQSKFEDRQHQYSATTDSVDSKRAKYSYGSTWLEAAMRCIVTLKMGEEIDIPDRLVDKTTNSCRQRMKN